MFRPQQQLRRAIEYPSDGESSVVLTTYAKSTGECVRAIAVHRRLLVALIKRELSDEYVSHGLSIGWTFIHPLVLMIVYLFLFTEVFVTRVSVVPDSGADAVAYLLSGIIPWLAISQVMSRSTMSVVGNSAIVKQMSFPLELLPIKTLAGPFMFAGVSLVFLITYGLWISGGTLLPAYLFGLPPLIIITVLQLAGLSLLLGCLQVFVRDLKEFINVFLTIGLFIHPILYLPNAIPAAVRPVIYISPFSYLIFCWQNVLFYGHVGWVLPWVVSSAFAVFCFVLGARVFIVTKHHFGDFL
jgi:lipopolysaccharide transport system permease protein